MIRRRLNRSMSAVFRFDCRRAADDAALALTARWSMRRNIAPAPRDRNSDATASPALSRNSAREWSISQASGVVQEGQDRVGVGMPADGEEVRRGEPWSQVSFRSSGWSLAQVSGKPLGLIAVATAPLLRSGVLFTCRRTSSRNSRRWAPLPNCRRPQGTSRRGVCSTAYSIRSIHDMRFVSMKSVVT